jgi:hypothetical protein
MFSNYIGPKLETWIVTIAALAVIGGLVLLDPGPRLVALARCVSQSWLESGALPIKVCYKFERVQITEERRARGPIEPKHAD